MPGVLKKRKITTNNYKKKSCNSRSTCKYYVGNKEKCFRGFSMLLDKPVGGLTCGRQRGKDTCNHWRTEAKRMGKAHRQQKRVLICFGEYRCGGGNKNNAKSAGDEKKNRRKPLSEIEDSIESLMPLPTSLLVSSSRLAY